MQIRILVSNLLDMTKFNIFILFQIAAASTE